MTREAGFSAGSRVSPPSADHSSYADFYAASSYSRFSHEVRRGGSFGLQTLSVEQGPHAFTDESTPVLLIGIRRRIKPLPARYHLGDRWISIDTSRPLTVVAPPRTSVDYDIAGDHSLLILAIPGDRLPELPTGHCLVERLAPVYESPFQEPLLTGIAERLWQESREGDAASTLFVDSGVIAILSLLLSKTRDPAPVTIRPRALGREKLRRVLDYIEDHLTTDLRLAELAAVACLSPFHFGRTFREAVGASPLRYVAERRVVRACALLTDPTMSMLSISLQCGFADGSHFATTFRRHRGMSPSAFRHAMCA